MQTGAMNSENSYYKRGNLNIRFYEEIDLIEGINGFSIAEIEKRARPGLDAEGEPLHNGGISDSGFLGANESLKEVLKADWETVQAMGTAHHQLATHIRGIWTNQFCPIMRWNTRYIVYNHSLKGYNVRCDVTTDTFAFKLGFLCSVKVIVAAAIFTPYALVGLIPTVLLTLQSMKMEQIHCVNDESDKKSQTRQRLMTLADFPEAVLSYIPAALVALAMKISKAQILCVTSVSHKEYKEYKEYQEDLFQEQQGWNEELTITNIHNGESVTIAKGVIDYIDQYGFYEGSGDQNKYRVDPKRLVTILTGIRPHVT